MLQSSTIEAGRGGAGSPGAPGAQGVGGMQGMPGANEYCEGNCVGSGNCTFTGCSRQSSSLQGGPAGGPGGDGGDGGDGGAGAGGPSFSIVEIGGAVVEANDGSELHFDSAGPSPGGAAAASAGERYE